MPLAKDLSRPKSRPPSSNHRAPKTRKPRSAWIGASYFSRPAGFGDWRREQGNRVADHSDGEECRHEHESDWATPVRIRSPWIEDVAVLLPSTTRSEER